MNDLSDFYGPNAGYVWDLYERYQQDPESVDAESRAFFANLPPDSFERATDSAPPRLGAGGPAPENEKRKTRAALSESAPTSQRPNDPTTLPFTVEKVVAGARTARFVREIGHLAARIDPLGSTPPGDPGLDPATHGLTQEEL